MQTVATMWMDVCRVCSGGVDLIGLGRIRIRIMWKCCTGCRRRERCRWREEVVLGIKCLGVGDKYCAVYLLM